MGPGSLSWEVAGRKPRSRRVSATPELVSQQDPCARARRAERCLPEPPHGSPQPIWSSLQPLAKLNLRPESLLFQPSVSQARLGADALPTTEWKGCALLAALLPARTGILQPVLPDALPPSGRALPAPASLAAPGLNRRPAEQ